MVCSISEYSLDTLSRMLTIRTRPNGWWPWTVANSRTSTNVSSALCSVNVAELRAESDIGPHSTRPVSMADCTTSALTTRRSVYGSWCTRNVRRSHSTCTSAASNTLRTAAHTVGPDPGPSISVTRNGCRSPSSPAPTAPQSQALPRPTVRNDRRTAVGAAPLVRRPTSALVAVHRHIAENGLMPARFPRSTTNSTALRRVSRATGFSDGRTRCSTKTNTLSLPRESRSLAVVRQLFRFNTFPLRAITWIEIPEFPIDVVFHSYSRIRGLRNLRTEKLRDNPKVASQTYHIIA